MTLLAAGVRAPESAIQQDRGLRRESAAGFDPDGPLFHQRRRRKGARVFSFGWRSKRLF
jgi:hypothetical protein